MRSALPIRAVAAMTAMVVAGCSTTTRLVSRETRQAQIRVESEPPGAVLVNGKTVAPSTPADVKVPYTLEERVARDGDYDTGLVFLVSGAIGLAAGIGATAYGVSQSNSDEVDSALGGAAASSLGVISILYGLIAMGAGGYLMFDARPDEYRTNVDPLGLKVGVDIPRLGLREVVVRPRNRDQANYGDLGVLRYRARQDLWEGPSLPPGLALGYESDKARIAAAVAATTPTTDAPPPRRAASPSSVVAVFDIDVRGQSLDSQLVTRMSDYLAMRLATQKKFSVVPRDQLRSRLRDQKKESYDRCFDQSCQIEIGKELAAEKSLSSAIVRFGRECKVTAVLYDLRTAASEGGATASGECGENALVSSLEEVVRKLSN